MPAQVHIFGIRHHGPGLARSLRAALETLEPDCLLVEGPPDAEGVLPLLTHPEIKPPVALLIYAPEEPSRAVYYPFATYSPEWQALDYALKRSIPARFMDLPQAHQLISSEGNAQQGVLPEGAREKAPRMPIHPEPQPVPPAAETEVEVEGEAEETVSSEAEIALAIRQDPLNWIAEAAGYSDGESWWEHMVEQRRQSADLFQGVLEVMTALREAAAPNPDPVEAQREAWMRQTIRAAEREGYQRIAVVCGAWHGPALVSMPPAKEDEALLKGLPKAKVAATWVPWTYGRLTFASGYGAGVQSPAWYEYLWHQPEGVVAHWMTAAARLFREEDLPASPASVIEAVRLAEALATVRDRPLPGLPELWEAAQSIFCFGSEAPMRLISEKLIVGERLGQVPEETPMLPIQQDLRKEQKRLRLTPEATHSDKDFDLRNETDLQRSHLLHRLNLLDIPWGREQSSGKSKGTFHELWRLQWHPEFEVKLIEANVWGNTLRAATARHICEQADTAQELVELTSLVERTLLADLPEAVAHLMGRLQNMAAITSDVPHLMEALPPLVNVVRYGNVRQTDTQMVGHVVDGLIARICIGLPTATASLNDEAATAMYPRLMAVHNALRLLQNMEHDAAWNATLARLADQVGLHGLIAGRCCRLLLDQNLWSAEEVERRMNLALSLANEPIQAAAWIEGLLRESGDVLVHTDTLWIILDRWVSALDSDLFMQLLPLLRRTFSTFSKPLRRQLGERARGGAVRALAHGSPASEVDTERAERILPLVAQILGLAYESRTS